MLQFLEGTNTTLQDHLVTDYLCPSQVTQISIAAPSFQVQSMRGLDSLPSDVQTTLGYMLCISIAISCILALFAETDNISALKKKKSYTLSSYTLSRKKQTI